MLNVVHHTAVARLASALALGSLVLTLSWMGAGGPKALAAGTPTAGAVTQFAAVDRPASTPPTAVIYAPGAGALYFPGDSIDLIGFATDAEDGTLGFNAISWKMYTLICPAVGACAETLFFEATGAFATTPVPAPSVPAGSYFFSRVEMTATDLDGDKTTVKHILGPDADSNGCMDAYTQKTVFQPPFTVGAADHISSGNAQNAHLEFTDITNPAVHLTVSWAHLDSYAGTAGQEISFGVLAVPFTLAAAGDHSLTLDTDLFAQLSASAAGTANSASSLAVYGGVLSAGGVMIGDIELMHLERAYDDLGGSNPNVTVSRFAHPYGFIRTIPAGSYHLMLVVATEAGAGTPLDQPGPNTGDGFAISMTRVAVLCDRRAPVAALAGTQSAGFQAVSALSGKLTPGLRSLGDNLAQLAAAGLSERSTGARPQPEAAVGAPAAVVALLDSAER